MMSALVAALSGCLYQTCKDTERLAYDTRCEEMAYEYRSGRPEKLNFYEMTDYFDRRLGMTVKDLEALLGIPYASVPEEMYFNYALEETVKQADEDGKLYPGTCYDRVLLYSEQGAPDHWVPDESFNLYFIIKDERVVAIKTLFP